MPEPACSISTRRDNLRGLAEAPLDVLILGGGINGAGVARDLALRARAANRPMRIGLIEQRHFASGTSGKNSHLIHGGLRYLKYFEIRLVRESLRERAVLAEVAPHLVEPLPFLIPMNGAFAALYYGVGLSLYDLLAAGSAGFGAHRSLSLAEAHRLEPGLEPDGMQSAAMYYDARVESSRLVLENIFDAIRFGVLAVNYARAGRSECVEGRWRVEVRDELEGSPIAVSARKVVDATGAWMGGERLRLVRGSHLVYPAMHSGETAVAYFESAGRIVFFIPWGERRDLTLVGTTDVDHTGSPDEVDISAEETSYLKDMVRRVFPRAAGAEPISAFSSLRPLLRTDSGSATSATREHRIWNDTDGVLRIAGGKYTTYRSMSEEAVDLVAEEIAPELRRRCATRSTPMGGNDRTALDAMRARIRNDEDSWIWKLYGVETERVLEQRPASARPGLTRLDAARIRHAVNHELAQRLRDVFFVSTYWGYQRRWDAASLEPYAVEMGDLLGWDDARVQSEIASVK